MVRLSVGIEDVRDIIGDLDKALDICINKVGVKIALENTKLTSGISFYCRNKIRLFPKDNYTGNLTMSMPK